MNTPRALIIGLTWPEAQATAAGVRTLQVVKLLKFLGYEITYSSAAAMPSDAHFPVLPGVHFKPIRLNHKSFDSFIRALDPEVVVFDRFLTEEYFGWRVASFLPGAIRILDTQDLHSLRRSREISLKEGVPFQPSIWKGQEITKRELASVYKSDLTLVISKFELEWFNTHTPIDPALLCYLPFLFQESDFTGPSERPTFEERKDFVFVGTGRHSPNLDAIHYLKEELWPGIRRELPGTNVHIYGSHLPRQITKLTDEAEGFMVRGWIPEAEEVVKHSRVNLAPLRFGAGLKGKVFQAVLCGTPSVMTPIASEGTAFSDLSGLIANSSEEFVDRAVTLYKNKSLWREIQRKCDAILKADFNEGEFYAKFQEKLESVRANLDRHRGNNLIGGMLLHHTAAASEYMGRWIELKEKRGAEDK